MLFNSFHFFLFFAVVYSLYLSLNRKWQNGMLLVASYIFYAGWDWRFLGLIWLSTALDYYFGLRIGAAENPVERKRFLIFSICVNLAILGFFKYFNFFVENFCHLLQIFGIPVHGQLIRIILPVGVSFYTFQSMSYTIDVYQRKIASVKSLPDFALFVAFFPQLLAGPISRAQHLLPQIQQPRKISLEKFYDGSFLIFWGLFQKIFVADNLAQIVNPIFAASGPYTGENVLLALYAFAFQIYCDFAGYSNIARGLSKCMGFELVENFRYPYFAANPREFWQRWHISLSTWLRDYLYIPLGGNRRGLGMTLRNLGLTMTLGGLWHGASWTFIFWGIYHGVLLMIQHLWENIFKGKKDGKPWIWMQRIIFFHLVCLGWLFFRAQSLTQVEQMLGALLFNWSLPIGEIVDLYLKTIGFFLWTLWGVEFLQWRKDNPMVILKFPALCRGIFYFICMIFLILFGVTGAQEFIYFQF